MPKPNILLIFTDQQAHNMMSCANNPNVFTPTFDRFASQGVRFTKAYCANPLCVPSRFSLMTGRLPSEIGVRGNEEPVEGVPQEIKNQGLGWKLKEQGYNTAYAGKVHLPGMKTQDLGFDFLCDGHIREPLVESCCNYLSKPHEKPFFLVASFINPHDICYMVCKTFETKEQLDQKYGRLPSGPAMQALDLVYEKMGDMDKESFVEKYCPPLPENFEIPLDEPEAINLLLGKGLRGRARREWTNTDFRFYRWVYARLTELVDQEVSEIIAAMDKNGHSDNTVIIFSSDHGDMDCSHRMEQKIVFYEESVRIPLIISWPGQCKAGSVNSEALVSNGLDLYPTICDIAGATVAPELKGKSLLPLLQGSTPKEWRSYLPIESLIGNCIVTKTHKYEKYFQGENSEQLRDLVSDPGETQNHLKRTELVARIQAMKEYYQKEFPLTGNYSNKHLTQPLRET